jgi:O-antigen ligase
LTLLLVMFWFAGSRSGWIAIGCVLAAGIFFRVVDFREAAIGLVCAVAVAVLVTTILPLIGGSFSSGPEVSVQPLIVPTEASTAERWITIVGGWNLFLEHPILGAGLGAFRNQMILAKSGIPLVIHSTALWLLAELGLVGFLAFSVPGFYVWITEWRRAPREPASAVVALCFVGFAVMSGPADMVYQRTFWLLVGAALAVPRLKDSRGVA